MRRRNVAKVVTEERWNMRKRRHEELLAHKANMAERRRGAWRQTSKRRQFGKDVNIQEREEECAREKIGLVEAIHIF